MKRRILRGILLILSALALLAAGAGWWVSYRLEGWANIQLRKEIASRSNGHYRLEKLSLRLGLWPGNVVVSGLVVSADTTLFPAQNGLLRLHLPNASILGINWWQALRHNELHVREIALHQPEIRVQLPPAGAANGDSSQLSPDSLLQSLLGQSLQQLHIRQAMVEGAHCTLLPPRKQPGHLHPAAARSNNERGLLAPVQVDSLNLRLGDLHIVRGQAALTNTLLPGVATAEADFVVHHLRWNTRKGSMHIARLALQHELLRISNLRFRPFSYLESPSVRLAEANAPVPGWLHGLFIRSLSVPELAGSGLDVLLPSGRRSRNTEPPQPLFKIVAPLLDTLRIATIRVTDGKLRKDRLTLSRLTASTHNLSLFAGTPTTLNDLIYSPELTAEIPAFAFTSRNGRYGITTGKATYTAHNTELRVEAVQFVPDSAFADSVAVLHKVQARLYTLYVPSVSLRGATLRALTRERHLDARELLLYHPTLHADSYRTLDTVQLNQLAAFNFYDVVKSALDSVAIAEVKIDSGEVVLRDHRRQRPQDLHARNLMGNILNFRVNEQVAQTPDKPFFADNIAISADVPQYTVLLPDSSHEIIISHIGISTAKKAIFVDSIWIQPTLHAMKHRRNAAVNAFIPHTEIRGVNVYEMYRDRILRLDGLYIQQPQIDVTVRRDSVGKRKSDGPIRGFGLSSLNVYPLISAYFQYADLGEVVVEDAVYRQHNYLKGNLLRHFEIPQAQLRLSGVHINDAPALTRNHLLYAQGFEASLHEYRLGLADSVHEILFGGIHIRSYGGDQRIELHNVALSPTYNGAGNFGSPRRYNLHLPVGLLEGVDLYKLFENRSLHARELRLVRPEITFRYLHQPQTRRQMAAHPPDLAGLIRGELNDLQLGKFALIEGQLDYDSNDDVVLQSFVASHLSGSLLDFGLNNAANSLRFPFQIGAAQIEGEISDCNIVLPDSSYAIQIRRMRLSEHGHRLDLDSVNSFPFHLPESRISNTAEVSVPHASLRNIDLLQFYTTRDIHIGEMLLQYPLLRINREGQNSGFRQRTFNPLQEMDVYGHIARVLHGIAIDSLLLSDGMLEITDGDSLSLLLPKISTKLIDLRVDSQQKAWDQRFMYAKNAIIEIENYKLSWNIYLSDFYFDKIIFETAKHQIRADSFRVIPRFSANDYSDTLGRQATYMEIKSPGWVMNNANIHDAVLNGRINIGFMQIFSPDFYLFIDQNYPDVLTVARNLPMDVIRNLQVPLRIDTALLTGGHLIYEERAKESDETGMLELHNMAATLYNLTNDTALLRKNPLLSLSLGSDFMDNGHFSIQALALQTGTSRRYEYEGRMEAMNLQELNRFLVPAHAVKVESGLLQQATFNIKSKNDESTGDLKMYYKDLKLSIINRKNPNAENRAVASALANALIRKDNPSRRHFRVGHVQWQRDPYFSVVYDMIQSLLSGIKSSAGLAKKESIDKKAGLRDLIRAARKSSKAEPSLKDDYPQGRKQKKTTLPDAADAATIGQ